MRYCMFVVLTALLLLPQVGQAASSSRHATNVTAWQPYGAVEGFEYKFPLNPALFDVSKPMASFKKVWEALQKSAEGAGFVLDKGKAKLRLRTKTYFDTQTLALQNAGFIIRVNTTYKEGRPDDDIRFSVKTSGKTPEFVLGTPLKAKDIKGKVSAEDNPYADAQGRIVSKLEKGVDIRTSSAALGNLQAPALKAFARFVPDLEKSGLTPDTLLVPVTAYTYSAKMGTVELGGKKAEIALEAWTKGWDGKALTYELSIGLDKEDYFALEQSVAAGDDFFTRVVLAGLKSMQMPDGHKFSGSKLQLLRNVY